jgi:hypothetical protein
MKKEPSPDWHLSVAGMLDSYRKLFEIVFQIQVQVTALERTLIETDDPAVRDKYMQHCEDVRNELEDSKAVAIHLLEKTAGQLRGDPKWKD